MTHSSPFSITDATIYPAQHIKVHIQPTERVLTQEQRRVADLIWEQAVAHNGNLFNRKVICYQSHQQTASTLLVQAMVVDYKYVYAHLTRMQAKDNSVPSFDLALFPLAVSGIVIDPEGNTLISRRGNVTEYSGRYELPPSGGASLIHVHQQQFDIAGQLGEEFAEELGLSIQVIDHIAPLGLSFDHQHQVYDIGCKMLVSQPLTTLLKQRQGDSDDNATENHEIAWLGTISLAQAYNDANNYIPTSQALLALL
jgi:hypothetical protein